MEVSFTNAATAGTTPGLQFVLAGPGGDLRPWGEEVGPTNVFVGSGGTMWFFMKGLFLQVLAVLVWLGRLLRILINGP